MAGSRKPGPLGSSGQHDAIDTGTLNRQLSPTPGPTCVSHGTPAASVLHPPGYQGNQPRRKHVGGIRPVEPVNFPELRLNSRGPDVLKLQRLLNSRLEGATPLKVDGWFGPRTREALLQAQAKFHLASDGIVGPKTWFRLVSAPISKTAKPDSGRPLPGAATPPASEVSVVEWSLEKRFDYVITETGKRLPANMRTQFIAMVTGTGRNILIGTFVIWAGGHLFGVSEIADAILLVAGVFFLGVGIFEASYDLTTFLMLTCSASTEADLNRAADNLAQAITLLGVMTFFALMAKVTDVVGKGAPTEEAAPPPEPPPTPRPRRLPTKEPPPEEAAPQEEKAGKSAPDRSDLSKIEVNGLKAVRIRPGTSDNVAVIGRSMKDVRAYAQGLTDKGYDVELFDGDMIPDSARAEWNLLTQGGRRLSDSEVMETQMYKANQAWAQKIAAKGYTIVDINNPGGLSSSRLY